MVHFMGRENPLIIMLVDVVESESSQQQQEPASQPGHVQPSRKPPKKPQFNQMCKLEFNCACFYSESYHLQT